MSIENTQEVINRFINHKFITKAQIAAALYDDLTPKRAAKKFSDKLAGKNYRKFNLAEEERILSIWEQFKKEIEG